MSPKELKSHSKAERKKSELRNMGNFIDTSSSSSTTSEKHISSPSVVPRRSNSISITEKGNLSTIPNKRSNSISEKTSPVTLSSLKWSGSGSHLDKKKESNSVISSE